MPTDPAALLPPDTVQFATGSAPGLSTGAYVITVSHVVDAPGAPAIGASQTVLVQGPQFTLPPQLVSGCYPPPGGAGAYGQELPFVAFADAYLPWETSPYGAGVVESPPVPWLALLLFAEGEIVVDAAANTPLVTTTVGALLTPDADTVVPEIALDSPWQAGLDTPCQAITVTAAAFAAVCPPSGDLVYLAHCRSMNVPGEPQQTVSTLLGNRLPLPYDPGSPGLAAVRYYAHVVSLEGLIDYRDHGLPAGCQWVRMVSLYNWTFLSTPETGAGFATLVQGLVASEAATGGALALPAQAPAAVPAAVVERLEAGYVALAFQAFDTQSFAWYRGPFSAAEPAPLPPVGSPPVPVENATGSDALLVYLTEQGVFDAGYAAAWNLGRGLALANGSYTAALLAWRQQAAAALAQVAERAASPLWAGVHPAALLGRGAARRRFGELMDAGLGRRWTAALERPDPGPGDGGAWARRRPPRADRAALLQHAEVVEAVGEQADEQAQAAAGFLGGLCLLEGVPFSALVPDARMLPVESVRFFHVDRDWIAALVAGAASLGVASSVDLALHQALWPRLAAAVETARRRRFARLAAAPATPWITPWTSPGTAAAGMLIRSELVSGFPTANLTAWSGGAELDVARDQVLSPSVRLCLFEGVPDTVTLAEPYHGLRFGIEPEGVVLRALSGTPGEPTGAVVPAAPGGSPDQGWNEFLAGLCAPDGVVRVAELAGALASGLGVAAIDPGELALQLVQAPLAQSFTFPS